MNRIKNSRSDQKSTTHTNVNVEIDKIITHDVKINFFSKTKIQCKSVVNANQGIRETFSTGSQNQNPPQPNS